MALTIPRLGRRPLVDRVQRTAFERRSLAVQASDDRGAQRFVSVGRWLDWHEASIGSTDGAELPKRTIGRVVFHGPSVTAGSWQPRRDSRHHTAGRLDGRRRPGPGYQVSGKPYITGRLKDLINKGGRNLVPRELEGVAGAVEGVRSGCVAACRCTDRPASAPAPGGTVPSP